MTGKAMVYYGIASALSVIGMISVMPVSLAWVSNPKPPKELLRK